MEAQQTRRCGSGSGGTEYEIDLNNKRLRIPSATRPYIKHAHKAKRGQRRRPVRTTASRERSENIRSLAKGWGIAVSDRGRIPASVVEQYQAATARA